MQREVVPDTTSVVTRIRDLPSPTSYVLLDARSLSSSSISIGMPALSVDVLRGDRIKSAQNSGEKLKIGMRPDCEEIRE